MELVLCSLSTLAIVEAKKSVSPPAAAALSRGVPVSIWVAVTTPIRTGLRS